MREIGVPKNFAKFTGKKETLFKKRLWHRFCRVNFAKSLEHLRTNASEPSQLRKVALWIGLWNRSSGLT